MPAARACRPRLLSASRKRRPEASTIVIDVTYALKGAVGPIQPRTDRLVLLCGRTGGDGGTQSRSEMLRGEEHCLQPPRSDAAPAALVSTQLLGVGCATCYPVFMSDRQTATTVRIRPCQPSRLSDPQAAPDSYCAVYRGVCRLQCHAGSVQHDDGDCRNTGDWSRH